MRDLSEIGLDTNCLTYLLTALEGIVAPTDGLAEQKVALVRLYLYTPGDVVGSLRPSSASSSASATRYAMPAT